MDGIERPADEAVVRATAQIMVIEKTRAYVEGTKKPIDLTNASQVAGHLMAAEVLLMEIAAAFEEPTQPERGQQPAPGEAA